MSLLAQLDQRIRHHGGLIVSCQLGAGQSAG